MRRKSIPTFLKRSPEAEGRGRKSDSLRARSAFRQLNLLISSINLHHPRRGANDRARVALRQSDDFRRNEARISRQLNSGDIICVHIYIYICIFFKVSRAARARARPISRQRARGEITHGLQDVYRAAARRARVPLPHANRKYSCHMIA